MAREWHWCGHVTQGCCEWRESGTDVAVLHGDVVSGEREWH